METNVGMEDHDTFIDSSLSHKRMQCRLFACPFFFFKEFLNLDFVTEI